LDSDRTSVPGGPRPRLEFPLLTADEVARTILGGVPVKAINQYAREGRIPSIWIGKHRRFNRPAVEDAVARAASRGGRL
jgi:excisionase family DNA binding protein